MLRYRFERIGDGWTTYRKPFVRVNGFFPAGVAENPNIVNKYCGMRSRIVEKQRSRKVPHHAVRLKNIDLVHRFTDAKITTSITLVISEVQGCTATCYCGTAKSLPVEVAVAGGACIGVGRLRRQR